MDTNPIRAMVLPVIALALCPSSATASAGVNLQVLATDPGYQAVLGRWQKLSLRVGYETDRPIHVRAKAFFAGRQLPAMSSGSPLYQVGTGEAYYWLAFTDPRRVDTIQVTAEGRTGKPVAQISIPVDLTWTGEASATAQVQADWAERMQAEQNRRIEAQANAYSNGPWEWMSAALGFAVMGCVPAYVIVQVVALWRMRGAWRTAAAVPLAPMVAFLVYAVFAFYRGSNLFPLLLILAAPPALLYLLAVMVVEHSRQRPA